MQGWRALFIIISTKAKGKCVCVCVCVCRGQRERGRQGCVRKHSSTVFPTPLHPPHSQVTQLWPPTHSFFSFSLLPSTTLPSLTLSTTRRKRGPKIWPREDLISVYPVEDWLMQPPCLSHKALYHTSG